MGLARCAQAEAEAEAANVPTDALTLSLSRPEGVNQPFDKLRVSAGGNNAQLTLSNSAQAELVEVVLGSKALRRADAKRSWLLPRSISIVKR